MHAQKRALRKRQRYVHSKEAFSKTRKDIPKQMGGKRKANKARPTPEQLIQHQFIREPIHTQWDVPHGPMYLISYDAKQEAVEILAHGDPHTVWIFIGSLGSVLAEACSKSDKRGVVPTIMFTAKGRQRWTPPQNVPYARDFGKTHLPEVVAASVEGSEPMFGSMSLGKWLCRVPSDAPELTRIGAFQLRPWLEKTLPSNVCKAKFPDTLLRVDNTTLSDDDLSKVPAGGLPFGAEESSEDSDDDSEDSDESDGDAKMRGEGAGGAGSGRGKRTNRVQRMAEMEALAMQQRGGGVDDDVVRVGDDRYMQRFLPR